MRTNELTVWPFEPARTHFWRRARVVAGLVAVTVVAVTVIAGGCASRMPGHSGALVSKAQPSGELLSARARVVQVQWNEPEAPPALGGPVIAPPNTDTAPTQTATPTGATQTPSPSTSTFKTPASEASPLESPAPPTPMPFAVATPTRAPLSTESTRPTSVPISSVVAQPTPMPMPPAPPMARALVATRGGPARLIEGRTMVRASFWSEALGASLSPVGAASGGRWRLTYFEREIEFFVGQRGVLVNGKQTQLPAPVAKWGDEPLVPLVTFAEMLGVGWSFAPGSNPKSDRDKTVIALRFPAARITEVRSKALDDRVRTVITLSNATRVSASQEPLGAKFRFAGAREATIPDAVVVGDLLVPRTMLRSGDWSAEFSVTLNYRAPVRWFTLGHPARLVIDSHRIFEEKTTEQRAGLPLTRIRKGTGHGPVQIFAATLDPRQGWRVRLASGGEGVLARAQPSRLAARHNAPLAINGGFFAWDGAAVGAVLINREWQRLPWGGRTAVGFGPDGRAHIGNLQVHAYADFEGGRRVGIDYLNGWPKVHQVTALTPRFGSYYKLRPGEMALMVRGGIVESRPGGGGVNVPADGFTLVASGRARPALEAIERGARASKTIRPINWPHPLVNALGGGPRLVRDGRIEVAQENFRADVTRGAAPRTAFGIDRQGRYIVLVADGRQGFYSTGLTLHELAATMRGLGAVDAMNLDGGGSTVMIAGGKPVNRPSDGSERGVANALLVTRG